jgi:hypothetical protein
MGSRLPTLMRLIQACRVLDGAGAGDLTRREAATVGRVGPVRLQSFRPRRSWARVSAGIEADR